VSKNTETLLIAAKEFGLDVNVENTKYVVMSRDQNSGQNHHVKIANK
jgi:hypothetical protein